jgi:uncharacterized protein (DUF1501 family)
VAARPKPNANAAIEAPVVFFIGLSFFDVHSRQTARRKELTRRHGNIDNGFIVKAFQTDLRVSIGSEATKARGFFRRKRRRVAGGATCDSVK